MAVYTVRQSVAVLSVGCGTGILPVLVIWYGHPTITLILTLRTLTPTILTINGTPKDKNVHPLDEAHGTD